MCAENSDKETPSRHEVWRMFDRIAHRYDLLNHLLSFNRDVAWRKKLVRQLSDKPDQHVLDLATGTADQLIALYRSGKVGTGVGVDPSENMLEIGIRKVEQLGLSSHLSLVKGNGENIPFDEGVFDAVTISFGIRNVTDVQHTLVEMHRVLRDGGRSLILEFSLPKSAFMKKLYLFYFRKILPRLGGIISGDAYAYRYLNQTVETFPYGDEFCDLMREAGYNNVKATPLTFGIATIYSGDR